jgi:GR25 family glycosyltransferase involved in LPS biosynthesis
MPFVGRYINMDASLVRRATMEAQFAAVGVADRYARFPGIDGRDLDGSTSPLSPGELGCFMSHYRCIVETEGEGHHLHILEDDVVLAPQAAGLLDRIIDDAVPRCDLLLTDMFMPLNMGTILDMIVQLRASGLFDQRLRPSDVRLPAYVMYPNLRHVPFGGATSYVVNHASRGKLIALLDAQIAKGPTLPIDMIYRMLANEGLIEAMCTVPFLTSIRAESISDTTIVGRAQDAESAMAFYVLRSFFYLARDEDQLMGVMREINAKDEDPDALGLVLEVLRFVFGRRFKNF